MSEAKTHRVAWQLKSRKVLASNCTESQGREWVREWAHFRRGLSPERTRANDMLVGGDGWAVDMTEVAAVSLDELPPGPGPQSLASAGPCWWCVLLWAVPLVASAVALTAALVK